MSLCVTVFRKDGSLYMGADSRESANINGQIVVRNNYFEKIRLIHNKVIFASGNSSLVKAICDRFEKQKNDTIEALRNIAVDGHNYFVNFIGQNEIYQKYTIDGELMTCCFTIGAIVNNVPVMYYLASNDGFKIQRYDSLFEGDYKVLVSGATNYVSINEIQDFFKRYCLKDAYLESYSKNAFEGIGGHLTVYKIDKKGITKFIREKIKDRKALVYEKDLKSNVFAHAIFAGKLQAASGTFEGSLQGASGTFSGVITGGSITSNTTINVTTDAHIGRLLYLEGEGDHGIVMSGTAGISFIEPGTLEISAADYVQVGQWYFASSLTQGTNNLNMNGNSILNVGNMYTQSQVDSAVSDAMSEHIAQYHT